MKKALIILMLAGTVMCAAACGAGSADSQNSQAPQASEASEAAQESIESQAVSTEESAAESSVEIIAAETPESSAAEAAESSAESAKEESKESSEESVKEESKESAPESSAEENPEEAKDGTEAENDEIAARDAAREELGKAFAGSYTDPDSGETGLVITDLGDGQFGISLSIFRLANFEDGRGELGEVSMSFNATDPAGNPISGKITLDGSTATATFLDSSWDLISNGDSFRYEKN